MRGPGRVRGAGGQRIAYIGRVDFFLGAAVIGWLFYRSLRRRMRGRY